MIFSVGDTIQKYFVINNKTYNDFIELSNDQNPLHTNEQFAISKGFKGIVMHGNILNAFLSYFIGESIPLKNVIIHSQEIQFKNPVYLNDALDFNAKVIEVYESVNAVVFKYIFRNSDSKVVAKGLIQIGII